MKRTALFFGSFNPVHRGHMALAEWILRNGICDEAILIVSPHNPLKNASELAPEFNRFEMCELACNESEYSDRIKVSAIEFLLEKPSYTINTLRYLNQNFGKDSNFSLLVGADNMADFDKWRSYEEILDNYEVMVYPRHGCGLGRFADRVRYLEGAPEFDFSSTEVRDAALRSDDISGMVCAPVAGYIREHGLWRPAK